MKKKTYLLMALTMVSMGMNAQNTEKSSVEKGIENFAKSMTFGGTIRSKYEYQTEEGEGRFEVRTARINVAGNVTLIKKLVRRSTKSSVRSPKSTI